MGLPGGGGFAGWAPARPRSPRWSPQSARRPLLLVLDDLHWADAPSLALLRFLGRELEGAGLLVVGIYRHTEVDRGHPLLATLADLTRGRGRQLLLEQKPAGNASISTDCRASRRPGSMPRLQGLDAQIRTPVYSPYRLHRQDPCHR